MATPKTLRALFDEASEIEDKQARRVFLDEACAGDAALRASLEELVRSSDSAGGFLADTKSEGLALAAGIEEKEGDRIGRYKLLPRTATNTVVISWLFPATGFGLEENALLGTTNWTSATNAVQKRRVAPVGDRSGQQWDQMVPIEEMRAKNRRSVLTTARALAAIGCLRLSKARTRRDIFLSALVVSVSTAAIEGH